MLRPTLRLRPSFGTRAMRIVALDDYGNVFASSSARKSLEDAGHSVSATSEAPRGACLVKALEHAEVALLTQQRTPVGVSELRALPKLKVILNTGRNSSHLDVGEAEKQGIKVIMAGQGDASPTAELTWTLILAAARKLVPNVDAFRGGAWQACGGTGLAGKTLGVLGLGRIGFTVAKVAAAFGMRIVVCGRPGGVSESEALKSGYDFTSVQRHVFAQADFLTIHVRAVKETEGMVSLDDLAAMKTSAVLINTSRSSIIAPGALEIALKSGRPGFCAIDVFDDEPVLNPTAVPLLQLPNVLATPHLGYCTNENLDKIYTKLVEEFFRVYPRSSL